MVLKQINDNLDYSYEFTAGGHWKKAEKYLEDAKEFKDIIHAALELRLCIERVCFEYLVVFTYGKRKLSKSDLKRYRPKDLISKVIEQEPDISKSIDFYNAIMSEIGKDGNMATPDFPKLQNIYGRLNNYLHMCSDGFAKEEKVELQNLVRETLDVIHDILSVGRGGMKLEYPHSKQILEDYIGDKITGEQMRRMVRISSIPLHMLNSPKSEDSL